MAEEAPTAIHGEILAVAAAQAACRGDPEWTQMSECGFSLAPYLFPFVCLLILLISDSQLLCVGAGLQFGPFINYGFPYVFISST